VPVSRGLHPLTVRQAPSDRLAEHRRARRTLSGILARWRQVSRSREGKRTAAPLREVTRLTRRVAPQRLGEWLASDAALGWLLGVESSIGLMERAATAARAPRNRAGTPAAWIRLMDAAAEAGILGRVAPHGALKGGFPSRVAAIAAGELARAPDRLAPIALPWFAPRHRRGSLKLLAAALPERGTPAGSIELPAAGVTLIAPGPGASLTVRLRTDVLLIRGLQVPWPVPAGPTGSTPTVGAPVRPGRTGLVVLPFDGAFERRVFEALELLRCVWPESADVVASATSRVVPLDEGNTVSFSAPAWPGVSFVNRRSAPMLRLAEDLLHEATHERLHRVERAGPLVRAGAPRVYSPWRREYRPLRGLLHGACTFLTGARFFERALAAAERTQAALRIGESRRVWLARRLIEESDAVLQSLGSLGSADRRGWLTPEGSRIVRRLRRLAGPLRRAARRRERLLASSAKGRRALERARRERRATAGRSLRWAWNQDAGD